MTTLFNLILYKLKYSTCTKIDSVSIEMYKYLPEFNQKYLIFNKFFGNDAISNIKLILTNNLKINE